MTPSYPPPSSLRAEATVELKKGSVLTGRAIIQVKTPASFRIEVFGPFGSTAALFASDGRVLTVFSREESKSYRWDDPALPYPFTSEDVVAFLLGADVAKRAGRSDIVALDGGGRAVKFTKFSDGKEVFSASMSDFRDAGGALLPFSVSIENAFEGILIEYSNIEVNPDIRDDIFRINPPR